MVPVHEIDVDLRCSHSVASSPSPLKGSGHRALRIPTAVLSSPLKLLSGVALYEDGRLVFSPKTLKWCGVV